MRQTHLFTKTRKESPKDEVSKNADLLIRAGFIRKDMAGVYTYLPLGVRVLNKIIGIIRDEMNAIGGQEVFLPALQSSELWAKTNRWNIEDTVWFKTKLSSGADLGLAFTHEEPITNLLQDFITSYKDLPIATYQFQNKFRNETRAKSGILRTREFIMKDMYSFSTDETRFREYYERVANAYMNIFNIVGLGGKTYRTFASGGSFSKFSDEFQTECEAGEDIIYIDEASNQAINKEIYTDELLAELNLNKEDMREAKAIEIGNIFPLGTRFSEPLHLVYKDESGKDVPVYMGSYGIGPGRVMGTIAEVLSDEKGLVWPTEVAPFQVHLVRLGSDEEVIRSADEFYEGLTSHNIEVLYDDRDASAGEKFNDSDLLGIPFRVIVSAKTVASGEYEMVDRATGKITLVTESSLIDTIQKYARKI